MLGAAKEEIATVALVAYQPHFYSVRWHRLAIYQLSHDFLRALCVPGLGGVGDTELRAQRGLDGGPVRVRSVGQE